MLDALRNTARGTAGKIIVGLIALTFVLFGAESIISIAGNSSPVSVNGQDVSELEYQRLLNTRQQELANQFGAEFAAQFANSDFLRNEVIETLVNQTVQLQWVSSLDLTKSEQAILEDIATIPAFQIDGQFDQNRYLNVLSANGFNHQTFVAAQKEQGAITQLQQGLVNSAFDVNRRVQSAAELRAQTRSGQYLELSAQDFEGQVVLTEEQIQNFYDEQADQFMAPERVKVRYLTLRVADLAKQIEISDNDLQSAYDSYVAEISAEAKREISHILFAQSDDALSAAQSAREALLNGADFAELAQELSDDPGSAEFGGSLGELLPGVYVEAFYEAAIQLETAGQISEPVETQYGYHLIKLDSVEAAQPESFEAKAEELRTELQLQRAQDEMLVLESQLADESFASDSIEAVAAVFDVSVENSDWITRVDAEAPFTEPAALEAVFSDNVINNDLISDVVRLASGDLLVAQKDLYEPEQIQPLADVREQVELELINQESVRLMTEAAEALAETKDESQPWLAIEAITRENTELPRSVVGELFQISDSATQGRSIVEADAAFVVWLSEVNRLEPAEDVLASTEANVDQLAGNHQFQMMFNALREQAEVEVRR